MSTVESPPRYTPEDLLTMPDGDRYELINGELVEPRMSEESSWVSGAFFGPLWNFNQTSRVGWAFPEGISYQCFPSDPKLVRKADTSFIRLEHLPGGPSPSGHTRIAPDLAVEVISPHDLYEEVDEKVSLWLSAGVTVVVVINPRTRLVHVYRRGVDALRLGLDDVLSLDDVIPGFSCRVADLFPPRTTDAE